MWEVLTFLGYYEEEAEIIDHVLDNVRGEVENTNCLQGMIVDYSIFPSPQISESIVEPYNAMLVVQHHSDLTAPGRTILPPDPFFAPLISRCGQSYRTISVRELVDQVFNPLNVMCAIDLRQEQNVTVVEKMNPIQTRRAKILVISSSFALIIYLIRRYRRYVILKRQQSFANRQVTTTSNPTSASSIKKALNKQFFHQLRVIVRILIPRLRSDSFLLLITHLATLLTRTFLSIYIAHLDGAIVKSLVQRNARDFLRAISIFLTVALPASFINSAIRFAESKLALAFRSKLTRYAYEAYFRNQTYFRVTNLDSRLLTPDQNLTDDIETFTTTLTHLFSHLTKPFFDVAIISWSLVAMVRQRKNARGLKEVPAMLAVIISVTFMALRRLSPHFGKLVSEEARRRGVLRFAHTRVIANAEEIAFFDGHEVEKNWIFKLYDQLREQTSLIITKKLWFIMLEQFLMKYFWHACGMVFIAIPFLTYDGPAETDDPIGDPLGISTRTEAFTISKNLLTSGADALERIISSYKEIAELAGHTNRVYTMLNVFDECSHEHYQKASVTTHEGHHEHALSNIKKKMALNQRAEGQIIESEGDIIADNVPIITPNGDIIVESLSLTITPNMHVLISGPNGCGKSSFFRIVRGLWPIYSGRLHRPKPSSFFLIPQRPYMCPGTLRDQIIYPHTADQAFIDDNELMEILNNVELQQIVQREGGLNAERDWKDILSGGEKQRLGLARIFYHKPKYALLDECTSAVSIDVEGKIYERAKALGISLLTITHRPSLWAYHTHLLQFDGDGRWTFEVLNTEKRLTLKGEKERLESQLAGVPEMQQRLTELRQLLGEGPEENENSDDD
ncbi:unnamed protein product [Rotaria magnacalcarata]|uniref:ATP-binding cassette sub-family D member 2 n=4 Tax=Rotaria magnacalcarata TaxID=392030 RepID=A0A819TP52_9BILA|nr:unnamed protein product [Rotaria magnacalcarata]CAF4080785.1 unnamed protein product [Rotaria magnacalcarata]